MTGEKIHSYNNDVNENTQWSFATDEVASGQVTESPTIFQQVAEDSTMSEQSAEKSQTSGLTVEESATPNRLAGSAETIKIPGWIAEKLTHQAALGRATNKAVALGQATESPTASHQTTEQSATNPAVFRQTIEQSVAEKAVGVERTAVDKKVEKSAEPERAENGNDDAKSTEIADTRKRADDFIRRHGQLLNFFSKDSSLRFVPSATADTFAFAPKDFSIHVPLSWFANETYTEGELAFANYHERAHFIDMRKNPEAYLDNFEQMLRDADNLARDYCRTRPEQTETEVKKFYYRELHTLYNCLDDIYANRLVTSRVPYFGGGDGKQEIATLYQKSGFGEADLTEAPLHKQMAYALLRDAMVGENYGMSDVDERVRAALDKKVMGKSMRTLVDYDLSPRSGILVDPAERYKLIRLLIQPKYLELLDEALKEKEEEDKETDENQAGENGQNGEQGDSGDNGNGSDNSTQDEKSNGNSGEGNEDNGDDEGGEQNIDSGRSEQSSTSQNIGEFDPFNDKQKDAPKDLLATGGDKDKVIRQVLDKFVEEDKVKKMSPEERAKYQARKRREEFDNKHGISKAERAENEEIKAEIYQARRKMREFWKRLIGKSVEYRLAKQRHQRKGRLNVSDYIRKYPEAVEAEQKGDLRSLEVYERNGLEHVVVDQPEKIDVTLLVDCSGSMSGAKVQAARETAALLMYSLKDFNDEIENTREQTHTKLRADTQVIAFGSEFAEVKPFETNRARADADIIKSISAIDDNRGSTNDAEPMQWIDATLTDEQKVAIQDKKLKKIIFEITDGEPDDPSATSASIRKLANDGVIVVGFQIGDVSEREQETFRTVWSKTNRDVSGSMKGVYIGSDINALPNRLITELSEMLGNIVI